MPELTSLSDSGSPLYDALPEDAKVVVGQAASYFKDLLDSDEGSAFLLEASAAWSDDRWVQLLERGIDNSINFRPPLSTYTIETFPYERFGAVARQALVVEFIKHLRRSYIEQPARQGMNVPYVDRRDYLSRWEGVQREEETTLKSMVVQMKRVGFGFGHSKLLVYSTSYPRYTPYVRPSRMFPRMR